MATLDEIFASMPEEAASGTHELLIIDPDTRQIYVPDSEEVFGVEHDGGAETKYFQCPRYVGNGLDLAACFLRINFQNANGDRDGYLVQDTTINGENIYFSWELTRKVTQYKGSVQFILCASLPGSTKTVDWHTTLAQGTALEGLEPDADVVEAASSDLIAQLLALVAAQSDNVEAVGAAQVEAVKNEGSTQTKAVKTAAENAQAAALAEIEAKKANAIATIPADYTAMGAAVDALERTTAPGIVCAAEGEAIVLHDASNRHLQGLRLFGRSTQDGTPTPEAPVEIVSLPAPAVTVCGKNRCASQEYGAIFPCRLEANVVYTASVDNPAEDAMCLLVYDQNQERLQSVKCTSDNGGRRYANITPAQNVYFAMWAWANATTVENGQIEIGPTATEYEPYTGQTLQMANGLPGIPVASGGNYTDADGQQWLCDEVDLGRGVYVQRVLSMTFDGTEDWKIDEYTDYKYLLLPLALPGSSSGNTSDMCTHATLEQRRAVSSLKEDEFFVNPHAFFSVSQGGQEYTSAEDWKSYLAGQYEAGTPVKMLYALAQPIETPLTEAEVAAWRALRSYKPTTTLLNDAGAHMAAEYVADTKLYIDNALAALIAGNA